MKQIKARKKKVSKLKIFLVNNLVKNNNIIKK